MALLQRLILSGNLQLRRSFTLSLTRLAKRQDSSSSDSDSSSDDEKTTKKSAPPKQKQKTEAANKLNDLLKTMMEEKSELKENVKFTLAKPREKQRQKDLEQREKKVQQKKFGEKLAGAAKEAAEELGGDVKQNEIELLARLLYKGKQVTEETSKEDASSATDSTAKKDVKNNLGNLSLNELLAGMKIDRSQPKQDISSLESRSDQVRGVLIKARKRDIQDKDTFTSRRLPLEPRVQIPGERTNLFGAEPLGIFRKTDLEPKKDIDLKLETWEQCFNKELKMAVTQPPSNIYEQMILWTEKGMLWHFPIDNEQGLDDEKKVYFFEHVHLERHLEGWCPDKGPIRHFMELVCVGLSKNPWLTVDEKLQHIWWFKEFFSGKARLIKEIGAGEIRLESSKEATT